MELRKKWNKLHQATPGFSLIEALIGTTILAVSVIAIVGVFPQSYRQVTRAGRVSTITHLAQEKIDSLKQDGYSHANLTAGAHPATPTIVSGRYYYPVTGFDNYSCKYTVTDFASVTGGSNDMKEVVVEVGYNLSYTDTGVLLSQEDKSTIIVRFQTNISE